MRALAPEGPFTNLREERLNGVPKNGNPLFTKITAPLAG
jgi:hypothetical protein